MHYSGAVHTIGDPTQLTKGAVVYNPALGFAKVEQVRPDGFRLAWEAPGDKLPRSVSREAACNGYCYCEPDGFFALSVLHPEDLRRRFDQETVDVIALLLLELDEPQSPKALKEWLTGRGLLESEQFETWWRDLRLESKPGFRFHKGRLSLEPGVVFGGNEDIFAQARDGSTPWTALPPLEGLEVFAAGSQLLGQLARVHSGGMAAGLTNGSITLDRDGQLRLDGVRGDGDPAEDLGVVGQTLLSRILGRPLPRHPPPWKLLSNLAGLAPPVPPSVLALLEQMLALDPTLQARNAIELYPRWLAAAAHEEIREEGDTRQQVSWELGTDTHVGYAKQETGHTNQDALALYHREGASLLLVADGISHSDTGTGEMAANTTVDVMGEVWREMANIPTARDPVRAFLESALAAANRAICDHSLRIAGGDISDRVPMGTTVVMALLQGETVDLAGLGDSRIYLVTPTGAGQLTPDMNYRLMRLVERDPSDLPCPEDNALTHYLGHFDEDGRPVLPPVWHRRLRVLPGETLVLCSDGVPDYACTSHAAFVHLLSQSVSALAPEECARHLIDAANDGGGGDNASAIVAKLQPL